MKILVLFGMIAIPAVAASQNPAQPENAPVREIASNAPGRARPALRFSTERPTILRGRMRR